MLNSFLLILFISTVFVQNLKVISIIFLIVFVLNVVLNKNLIINLKKLKVLVYIYMVTFIIQIISHQNGEVLFKVFNIYVTKNGVVYFLVTFLRIINLMMISWLAKDTGFLMNKLGRYRQVIENVIRLIPEVFVLFKRRLKFKSFLRYILREIKLKDN
ncbi:CbiQ family ECF transporter T component [Fusobacterium sp. IOR10]|uniref:CbiQ family ECF transporter T component n=1 Tax=Fusobacterium sp. IOR10 TaxID=2665157 RepID=UPI0013D244CC|nr:CbiQ family ECF transporter T component [Fusobacterium sp. IOR10]